MIDYFEHIDAYQNGALSGDKLEQFEAELATNMELQSMVENYDLAKEISLGFLEKEVRDVLNEPTSDTDYGKDFIHSTPNSNWIWWALGIILLLTLLGGYFLFEKQKKSTVPIEEFERIPFASIYHEPAWPIHRGNEEHDLSEAIKSALGGQLSVAVKALKNTNLSISDKNYWISELYSKAAISDSVIYYLPSSSNIKVRRDRINYLRIINTYNLKKYHQVSTLIKKLPDDTDEWYMKLYQKIN